MPRLTTWCALALAVMLVGQTARLRVKWRGGLVPDAIPERTG